MTDWSQLIKDHGRIVWATVYRLLRHEADSADCFQQTFVSALEFSRKETVRHWPALLRRLATARALEFLRKRHRDRSRFRPLIPDVTASPKSLDPSQAVQAGELADDLRHALAELDEVQAQVFCLACLDDCRYEEIAEHLGLTANHVGVLLNRARANLRKRLSSHEPASVRREGQQ